MRNVDRDDYPRDWKISGTEHSIPRGAVNQFMELMDRKFDNKLNSAIKNAIAPEAKRIQSVAEFGLTLCQIRDGNVA